MALSKEDLISHSSFLSNDPMTRVPPEMKARLEDPKLIFDVHYHLFDENDLPDRFLPVRFDIAKRWVDIIAVGARILDLLPILNIPDLTRLLRRLRMSEEEHLVHTTKAYDKCDYNPIYVALMMDMSAIHNEKKKLRSIKDQMIALAKFRDQHPDQILPYVALDPRMNENMEELFIEAFKKYNFFGVKIYPSLGYRPSHPRLMNVFEICEKNNIPVLAHCSSGKTRASNQNIELVWEDFDNGQRRTYRQWVYLPNHKGDTYKYFFNGPEHWVPVLKAYPKLRLNIAHFGGEGEWKLMLKNKDHEKWIPKILELLSNPEYPNVFTDFSYTFSFKTYNRKLKQWLREKPEVLNGVLHGSDYFLTATDKNLRKTLRRYFREFSSSDIQQMGVVNPKKYLF